MTTVQVMKIKEYRFISVNKRLVASGHPLRNDHVWHAKPITRKTPEPSKTGRLPGGLRILEGALLQLAITHNNEENAMSRA